MPDFTGKYNNRKGNGTVGKKMLFVFNPKAGKGKIKTHLLDIIAVSYTHLKTGELGREEATQERILELAMEKGASK